MILDLVQEWEAEAGTTELKKRWTMMMQPNGKASRPSS